MRIMRPEELQKKISLESLYLAIYNLEAYRQFHPTEDAYKVNKIIEQLQQIYWGECEDD